MGIGTGMYSEGGMVQINGGRVVSIGGDGDTYGPGGGIGGNYDNPGSVYIRGGSVAICGGIDRGSGKYKYHGAGIRTTTLEITGGSVYVIEKNSGVTVEGIRATNFTNGDLGGNKNIYPVAFPFISEFKNRNEISSWTNNVVTIGVTNKLNYAYKYAGDGHLSASESGFASSTNLYFYLPDGKYLAEVNGYLYKAIVNGSATNFSFLSPVDISINGTAFTLKKAEGWKFENNEVVITDDAVVMGENNDVKITVADGVDCNLRMDGLVIDSRDGNCSPIRLGDQSNIKMTLAGTNNLIGADGYAGINVPPGSSLIVSGGANGKIDVQGGRDAAGIGGNKDEACGSVKLLDGVVCASGGLRGAGVGGGWKGDGGVVEVSGGTLTALGGARAAGIGGGYNANGTMFIANGGSIKAVAGGGDAENIGHGGNGETSGTRMNFDGGDAANVHCVAFPFINSFTNNRVSVRCGDYTYDYEGNGHADDDLLYFYLPNGSYRTNVNGVEYSAVVNGSDSAFSLIPVKVFANGKDLSLGYGDGWRFSNQVLTVDGTIDLNGESDKVSLVVPKGAAGDVTLNGLSLDTRNRGLAAVAVESGVALTLVVNESNSFVGATDFAGINVPPGAKLVIDAGSSGSLSVVGGDEAAGIGGNRGEDGGDVEIRGGTMDVAGGMDGAGIGGGYEGSGGNVEISGGTVTVTGGEFASAIGGGFIGNGGNVIITGGSVKAIGDTAFGAEDIGIGADGADSGALGNGRTDVSLVKWAYTNEVTLAFDDYLYRYSGNGHEGDENLYFYLPKVDDAGATEVKLIEAGRIYKVNVVDGVVGVESLNGKIDVTGDVVKMNGIHVGEGMDDASRRVRLSVKVGMGSLVDDVVVVYGETLNELMKSPRVIEADCSVEGDVVMFEVDVPKGAETGFFTVRMR